MINLLSAFPMFRFSIRDIYKRRATHYGSRKPAKDAAFPLQMLFRRLPLWQFSCRLNSMDYSEHKRRIWPCSRRKLPGSLSNRRRLKKCIAEPLAFLNDPNPYAA
jgi:hypothetical protein